MAYRPLCTALALASLVCLVPRIASAQYIQRANVTTSGKLTFTGNTLGLDGDDDNNRPGTRGAIATFITTDTTQQDDSPPPGFQHGTTSDWRLNNSSATLRVPAGARVVHAELIWGGSYADRDDELPNVLPFIDDPVQLTTPAGVSIDVTPNGGQKLGSLDHDGTCNKDCYYARTADVTAIVRIGGAGTYTVGRVPATQGTRDENAPVAGWTLAVIYEDFTLPIRNLTLFLGLEQSGGAAAPVSGFCTPTDGPLSARLAVSAIEGDAKLTGDKMLFGPTSRLDNGDRVAGPRNPIDNFFSGQLTDDSGNLDTSGTFGNLNHSPGHPVDGARQGWDITNVDASDRLSNDQSTAFAQGTTDGDNYFIVALGLQIDVRAPKFFTTAAKEVDRLTAQVGDTITYTVHVDNSDGTADANNVLFFDPPPPGTSFVAGSLTVDGVARPGADPVTAGVPLGTIARGESVDVTLQVRVDAIPAGPAPNLRTNVAHWTFDFVSCEGQAPLPGTAQTNDVVTRVPVADLSIATAFLNSPAVAGSPVTYQITVQNEGPSAATATVNDGGTAPALTAVTWTCTPQSGGSTCGAPSGSGTLAATSILPPTGGVVYTVTGTLPAGTAAGTIGNTATVTALPVTPDFNLANNTATASAPIVTRADVRLSKSGPATGQRGDVLTYTIVVTNDGPSNAENVLVTDPTPQDLTGPMLTGPCTVAPGCTLAAGASENVTAQFTIPPGYPVTSPDPIVNLASVTTSTTDLKPANNTARASTAIDAPVADLSITKSNGTSNVAAGTATTYTITVANAGPATAPNARVVDTLAPAVFTDVTWSCAASGTSSCAVAGPQTGNIDALVTVVPGTGNAVVFTVQATVRPTVTGTVENTATVSTATGESDPNDANNSATDTDTIVSLVDVSVAATGPASLVAGGAPGTYTVVVTNSGPSTARDIPVSSRVFGLLTDRPELITGFTAPPGFPCRIRPYVDIDQQGFILLRFCDIPTLEPAATATFTVEVTIPPGYPPLTIDDDSFVDKLAYREPDVDVDDYNAIVGTSIGAQADVTVVKTGPASVVAGSTASYFLQVTNNGPSVATDVVLSDPTPAGLVFVGADGACSQPPCTILTLAPGESRSTRVDILIPPDYAGPDNFVNTATVTSLTSDPDTGNNTSSTTTLVAGEQTDVLVEKTGPAVVTPGGRIEYTARVVNRGTVPARDVVWADSLPGGTKFVSGTPPPAPTTCTVPQAGSAPLVTCTTPLLAVGATLEYRFVVDASPDLVVGSALTNVATVSSATTDTTLENNRAELTTRVAAADEADVQVTKTDATDPIVIGNDVTYTLTVTNAGPATATNVALTDTLPAALTLVSAVSTQGSCAATTCSLGTMAPGATATVTLVATPVMTGRFENIASVSATEPDPVPANNVAAQPTTVGNVDDADLTIEKAGPRTLGPGDTAAYTLTVTNRGAGTATGIEVNDSMPTGLTFVNNAGGCITPFPCGIESLAPGESRVITTTISVDPGVTTPSTLINTATVSSLVGDPDLTNNTSSVPITLYPSGTADLRITKRDSPDPVVAGSELSYVLIVDNRGPATAMDVTVTDVLPAGTTIISSNATRGTCTGTSTITCALPELERGKLAQIQIRATAPAELPSPNPMINTASVASATTADPDSTNDSVSEPTTVVARADVEVTKAGPNSVTPGTSLPYTLTVVNNGPSSATGVVLADPKPPGLFLVAVSGACTALPCQLGTMPPGASRTVQAIFLVPFDYTAPVPIINTATVASDSADPEPANNTSTMSTGISRGFPLTAIVGRVTDGDGAPLTGVRIELTGDGTQQTATGSDGRYAFTGVSSGSSYAVAPASFFGYVFTPVSRTFAPLDGLARADFVGMLTPYSRYYSEGATGPFFTTTYSLTNPWPTSAAVSFRFQLPAGNEITHTLTLPARQHLELDASTVPGLESTAFSTVITADQQIFTARTMDWDRSGYGSHRTTGVATPRTTWYLAEGATLPNFSLFYLLQNPGDAPATVTVRYLVQALGSVPVVRTYVVAPHSRYTIGVHDDPALAHQELSAVITTDGVPIVVERAMYKSDPRLFEAGTAVTAAPAPATTWYFAEGATGTFFDMFLLLANPGTQEVTATVRYLLPDGAVISKVHDVPAGTRRTVWVDYDDPLLADSAVAMSVEASAPIVAERAMWWPGSDFTWTGGHATVGSTFTAPKWGVSGLQAGGPSSADPWILVANPGATPTTVRMTLLFGDGRPPVVAEYAVGAQSRFTIDVATWHPETADASFGAVVEQLGDPTGIVVESAVYRDSGGVVWAAGRGGTATPIP